MSTSASSSRSTSPEPEVYNNKRKRRQPAPNQKEDTSSDDSDSESEKSGSEGEDEEPSSAEEPVLSHKERRKKKKEEKLAAKLAEAGKPVKKRKLKDGTAQVVDTTSTTIKRQNSVWVGNMSYKTTQENLRSFFKDCGEITRVHLPTKAPAGPGMKPENRGFAYVDFATPESKAAAIALSEQPLLGRKLLIKDGDDFTGRPAAIAGDTTFTDAALAHKTHSKTAQKILRSQKQPPAPTLFFGNLGFETTEDSIRELLEAHRPAKKKAKEAAADADVESAKPKDEWMRKIRMGTFEDSGLCKGFAFVDFTSVEHATAALINPKNHHLNGRNLVVEYASPDAVRRGAPKSKSANGSTPKGKSAPRNDRFKSKSDKVKQTEQKPEEDVHGPSEPAADVAETPVTRASPKKQRDGKEWSSAKPDGVRQKGPKSRPKPGAALALAKRESAAIVPSQGQKITF